MNPVYPEKVSIYANLNGVWSDISSDVISSISANWGINSNSPISRLADTGMMKFTLLNNSGKYTPSSSNKLAGWKTNTEIKLVITYQNDENIKFIGKISGIAIDADATDGKKTVQITVTDWLDYAAKYPLPSPAIQQNKRGNEVIETILSGMPIQPQSTSLDIGENVFPLAFGDVTSKTRGYSEFNRISLSEIGYIYLTKNKNNGETLVFENATNRNGLKPLSKIPKTIADSGFLLAEDGSYLLAEDGSKIILNEATTFHADNTMQKINVNYGKNVINQLKVRAYPKKIDTTVQTLFTLNSPLLVPAAGTIKFTGTYIDPVGGGSQVNGMNMVTPVSGIDFVVNTKQDNSGTDITSSCTIVAIYGSQNVDYTISNNYTQAGYVVRLTARGLGIYSYNSIESVVEAQKSIDDYGYETATLEQKYQTTLTTGSIAAQIFVNDCKEPKPVLEKISFLANASENLFNSFLYLDVGSKVWLSIDDENIDNYFYIQAVEFDIALGGTINYSWKLVPSYSIENGLSLAEVHFGINTKDSIDYGYLPHLCNLYKRTYTCWIKADPEAVGSPTPKYVMGINSDFAGMIFIISSDKGIRCYARSSDWPGQWSTPTNLWTPGVWFFIAVTRDNSVNPNADPIIYFNGVAQTLVEDITPVGTYRDESGCFLVLGNSKTASIDYGYPAVATIRDARIYNRVLTPTEITSLYADGEVTSGLVFQGPVIKTNEAEFYDNQVLNSEMKLIDNIYGSVGTPIGSPLCKVI